MAKVCMSFLTIVALSSLAGCGREIDPESLPKASDTLVAIGKRLGNSLSPEALETLGRDEPRLLRSLNSAERRSLARGYLRFRVDRPVLVEIAVLASDKPPFWLQELGFKPTEKRIDYVDGPFKIWTNRYEAGTVGLGVNSLDRRVRGHYLVFIRGESSAAEIDLIDKERGQLVGLTAGVAPYSDDARPLLSMKPQANVSMIQTRRDQRHDSALVRGKVWKTRLVSSPKPDQVVVSLGADPARSLSWTWRTDTNVKRTAVKLEQVGANDVRLLEGDFVKIHSDGLLNDPIVHRHRVQVDGLLPDTEYHYALFDAKSGGWTEGTTVRTAPDDAQDFSFLAMGDPQCGLEEWGKLLKLAHQRHKNAGFLVIAGDLVDRGNERSNWDHFFMRAEGVFDRLPLMPCVGNHEYLDKGPDIFKASFVLPKNGPSGIPHELTYSFEYNNAFMAVLDSNPAVYSDAKAAAIGTWLDAKLTSTKARWKFVVFHHPVYPSHPSRAQPGLAKAWIPLFEKHGVDIVLQGHDHAYLRTYPMKADKPMKTSSEGPIYVVSVSGQKFVPLAERPYTAVGFANVATYQVIDISPRKGTLVYRAFDVDGNECDRFEIVKSETREVVNQPSRDSAIKRSALSSQSR